MPSALDTPQGNLVNGRDHAIAAHVDEQIKKARPVEPGDASGTTPLPRPPRLTNEQGPGSQFCTGDLGLRRAYYWWARTVSNRR
ncbi:hypothetical protein [Streptomyces sp. NPDC060035]|uniref:hypothetical protein n=1 Tax=Streptomyces sp. NPDC060035 TaxID=3347044 RepID=UPI0036C02149